MKFSTSYVVFFLLIFVFSCRKEYKNLPNGYYTCILSFDKTGNTVTAYIKKINAVHTLHDYYVDFEHNNNGTIEYSSLDFEGKNKIVPGTIIIFNHLYYPNGTYSYDEVNKTHYIKGTFFDANDNDVTGTFEISKQVE